MMLLCDTFDLKRRNNGEGNTDEVFATWTLATWKPTVTNQFFWRSIFETDSRTPILEILSCFITIALKKRTFQCGYLRSCVRPRAEPTKPAPCQ